VTTLFQVPKLFCYQTITQTLHHDEGLH